jgi:DNA repair protein RadC
MHPKLLKQTISQSQIRTTLCEPRELRVKYRKGKSGPKINCSADAVEIFRKTISDRSSFSEEFLLLALNRANNVIGFYRVSTGGVSGTVADPKIIFSIALQSLASGLILCHNHPSGNLNPSQSDIQLTKNAKQSGKLLDISVLDHIILTDESYYSFADEGLL